MDVDVVQLPKVWLDWKLIVLSKLGIVKGLWKHAERVSRFMNGDGCKLETLLLSMKWSFLCLTDTYLLIYKATSEKGTNVEDPGYNPSRSSLTAPFLVLP